MTPKQLEIVKLTKKWRDFYAGRLDVNFKILVRFSNKMTKCAGTCRRLSREVFQIKYSNIFIEKPGFEKTVAHEVAHAFTDFIYKCRQKHGWRWKQIFEMSGYSPDIYHDYECKYRDDTIIYKCGDCLREVPLGITVQSRIYTGHTNYKCRCGSKITAGNVFGAAKIEFPEYLK